jgi:type IV pilus assembly protein PilC
MKISKTELYRRLATLSTAGFDLERTLHTSITEENGTLHDAVIEVTKSIERGVTLSGALAKHPKVFPVLDRAIIEVGEKSGRLPEVFKTLAEWYELKAQLWRIIKSGMGRPIFSIHAAAFILPIHMVFMDLRLEYILSVLFFLMIFYVPTVGMISLYRSSSRQGNLRKLLERVLLKIPILGKGLRDIALARYCFGFWALYTSGFPMPGCAEIAADLSGNAAVSAMFCGGKESAQQGKPVSKGFSPDVPRDFLRLWVVGEESGRFDQTLRHLYEIRIEQGKFYLKEFSRWLPRMIYFFVVIVIGYYLLSKGSIIS